MRFGERSYLNPASVSRARDSVQAVFGVTAASICSKFSALADLFDYLCEKNAITHNAHRP